MESPFSCLLRIGGLFQEKISCMLAVKMNMMIFDSRRKGRIEVIK